MILTSPVAAWRLFAVRIVAMAVTIALMSLVLWAPFINVLAWRGGIAQGHGARGGPGLGTRALSPSLMLRRKEWALLRRDPWLVSQTLVQILYLLPADAKVSQKSQKNVKFYKKI